MTYSVKEIFYSLQGEGARAGRASVFCRFSGCNLWSGEERHRLAAECNFCDTDFVGVNGVGGGKFESAKALSEQILSYWHDGSSAAKPYVVFTGGEPLLQLDKALIDAMHALGFEVAVETNGTITAPDNIDWLCVSPKGQTKLKQCSGNELKLVYPQLEAMPEKYKQLEFDCFYLQPLENTQTESNQQASVEYCLANPQWQLSLQTHKTLGIR